MTDVYGVEDVSFRVAGGYEGVKALVDAFYNAMEALPEATRIRDMHPEDLAESRDKLTRFMCGWLGGPPMYREKYGLVSIPPAHAHL